MYFKHISWPCLKKKEKSELKYYKNPNFNTIYRIVCGYIIFYIFWRFTPTGYINFAVYADRIHIFCGLCRPDTNIWRFMPTGYIDLAVYANRIHRFGGLCRPDTYIWRFMPTRPGSKIDKLCEKIVFF